MALCVCLKPFQFLTAPFGFLFSDAQLPDTLRVVYTNLAKASKFWTFWYQNLEGSGSGGGGRDNIGHTHRTTRQTVSVDESTKTSTPYYLPTTVDRNRGKNPRPKSRILSSSFYHLHIFCELHMRDRTFFIFKLKAFFILGILYGFPKKHVISQPSQIHITVI
jgi:hypothetical protein